MATKNKLRHKLELDVILKCLWALRDEPFYYFETYGKDFIAQYVKQKKSETNVRKNSIKQN